MRSESDKEILVSSLDQLLSHSRFFLNLRSAEGEYHSLILFRLSDNSAQENEIAQPKAIDCKQQIYAMEATCPHLGADMSHAEIEECDTGLVAVCPWHRYDFDLRTGASETGLKACTYAVNVRRDDSGDEAVWVETPENGTKWRLVELRPVSEEFADPPPPPDISHMTISDNSPVIEDSVVPGEGAPSTLMQWAVLILNTPNPKLKVERTRHAVHLFRTGQLKTIGHRSSSAPRPPDIPPREDAFARNTVDPGKVGKRKNRAVMLHALANIEQWAWDIMARYGPEHPDLPPAFFSDFAKMALDESKHFSLLTSRLAALSPTTPYGSLPVHASLWESARVTSNSLRARLAIIHLVHEARGLDVNPGTIEKFRRAGDSDSVDVLNIVHRDEVTHQGVDPRCWRGEVKGPFNVEDREKAGMTREFFENLKGEMPSDWGQQSPEKTTT
ncbi:DUF455-domain-containing protein [Fomitopsis serialis]|uniref:DUF455-domain-containing protein n=1 Tax=Fomitopsis serialis TaxID=139415 RepID=UPI0020073A84|nr:DUF455-domain-containing protein [Neoantrodia serialis]KAH9920616.1 DUF455-domain-containing protein [Neoantrodia serialis]